MKHMEIKDVLYGTGGTLSHKGSREFISGVRIDSREVEPGHLFVAIKGDNNDGHKYISQVVESGCSAVLLSDEDYIDSAIDCNFILVEDTVAALQSLSSYYLDRMDIKIIGVTGSVGKTSTSDMVFSACSQVYKTAKTMKNYNNHIGMPLSILEFDEDTRVGVLEMGMDKPGEIDFLASIAKPDIGIITNIGISHIENLGSRENIFKAKMEIVNYFNENNCLVVNGDDEYLAGCNSDCNYKLVSVGKSENNQFTVYGIDDKGEDGVEFSLRHNEESCRISIPVMGRHNAGNAALAIAAANQIGISMEDAGKGLTKLELTEKRLDIKEHKGIKVIDDTYNASPASMRAAVDVLMSTKGLRKVAILGDMYELGSDSDEYHRQTGEYASKAGTNVIITIGESAKFMAEGADDAGGSDVRHYADKQDFDEDMNDILVSGDVVLVKGSRGMHMDHIVKRIMER